MIFFRKIQDILHRNYKLKSNVKPYIQVLDTEQQSDLIKNGFTVAGRLSQSELEQINKLYNEYHKFEKIGGMFYSVYSEDLEYRLNIHIELGKILKSKFDSLFKNYKSVLNSFIVKTKGDGSTFQIHQDSSGLDETKYSPLSVWIPLEDVTSINGCLAILPKSHHLANPYRGISFPSNFENHKTEIIPYLIPVNLKKGDIFCFDNRLIHSSFSNQSSKDRIVVMSGIFPEEASLQSCFRDQHGTLEIFEQEDDFLIKNLWFYNNCTERPYLGKVVKTIPNYEAKLSSKELYRFLGKLKKSDIRYNQSQTNYITEPLFSNQL